MQPDRFNPCDEVARSHTQYAHYNQAERADDARMARLGHPHGALYSRLRRFFDRLRFASNSSARRFTYIDEHEHSEYWTPALELSWYPRDLEGFVHCYPAHPEWFRYIDTSAEAGWPAGVGPDIWPGLWHIVTRSRTLHRELVALAEQTAGLEIWCGSWHTEHIAIEVRGSPACATMLGAHAAIVRLLRRHQGTGRLPLRSPEDDARDNAPLPLSRRQFHFYRGQAVRVTDHHVLVPLVPLGGDPERVSAIALRLTELCEQGFPFTECDQWFQQFLQPASVAALRRRFS